MSDQSADARIIAFGPFEADLRTKELRRKGFPVRLPAQSFEVLRALLAKPGELVTRQELQKALWPDDSFGDFEHGLNAAVNRLRDALGDSADNPHVIETLPRRGYRFVGSIRPPEERESSPRSEALKSISRLPDIPGQFTPSDPIARPLVETAHPSVPRRTLRLAALSAMLALLPAIALVAFYRERSATQILPDASSLPRAVPLTSLVGNEVKPSLSPDGSQVVFSWDQGHSDKLADLFIKVIGSEHVQQLTHSPAEYLTPAWSPDGRTIAFLRLGQHVDREAGLFTISALGGPERRVVDGEGFDLHGPDMISWFPDSQTLAFSDRVGIKSVQVDTNEVKLLCSLPACADTLPAVSPDGHWIAFYSSSFSDIELMSAQGASVRKLVDLGGDDTPLAWTADSTRLAFEHGGQIVTVPVSGGRMRTFGSTHDVSELSIAREGSRLAYSQTVENASLWRMEVGGAHQGQGYLLEETSVLEREPDISPDGKHLSFVSARSGFEQVWVSDSNGDNAVQLTHAHALTGSPRWSPDGKLIAFDSRDSGRPLIYVVEPGTGITRQVSTGNLDASTPTWSRDGHWIYFTEATASTARLYKVQLEGGLPRPVSHDAGWNAQESWDGTKLYFAAGSPFDVEIHMLTLATGSEVALTGMPKLRTSVEWCLSSKGIYFINEKRDGLSFFELSSHHVERTFSIAPAFWGGLSLSRDETWIAYSHLDRDESDLMLIEGFR